MAMWFCGVLVLWFSLIVDELVLDIVGVWFKDIVVDVWFVVYFPSTAEWVFC
jgi:hypothetical protein